MWAYMLCGHWRLFDWFVCIQLRIKFELRYIIQFNFSSYRCILFAWTNKKIRFSKVFLCVFFLFLCLSFLLLLSFHWWFRSINLYISFMIWWKKLERLNSIQWFTFTLNICSEAIDQCKRNVISDSITIHHLSDSLQSL